MGVDHESDRNRDGVDNDAIPLDSMSSNDQDVPQLQCNILRLMERENLRHPMDFYRAAERKGFTVNRSRVKDLMVGTAKRISLEDMAIYAEVLRCTIGDLFERVEASIWNVVATSGVVRIHLASRTMSERAPELRADISPDDLALLVDREYLGVWDVQAAAVVLAHVYSVASGARVQIHVHPYGIENGYFQPGENEIDRLCDGIVHVLIGSPAASTFTERVVSSLYGVTPYVRRDDGPFPYRIAWPPARDVRSSFGLELPDNGRGIVEGSADRPLAERTLVTSGKGYDGALLLTHRFARNEIWGSMRDRTEGALIGALGISGPGTLAAAIALTSRRHRGELYPAATGAPLMRALRATYSREGNGGGRDDRKLQAWELL